MFVFGADSDTVESLSSTADFAARARAQLASSSSPSRRCPGTRQTAQFEAEGRIFTKNWSLYDGHHVVFWPKQMTPYELQMVTLDAHKRFYTRQADPRHAAQARPRYRKHQCQGYLMSARLGARSREPRVPARAARSSPSSQAPPASAAATLFKTRRCIRDRGPVWRRRPRSASLRCGSSHRGFPPPFAKRYRGYTAVSRNHGREMTLGQGRGLCKSEGWRRQDDHDAQSWA